MTGERANALPRDARIFPLRPGTKLPATPHGHHDAGPWDGTPILGNYGIALDGQFILVDFDDPDAPAALAMKAKLPPTWRQTTRRGEHWLYRVPEGWTGSGGVKLGKPPFGDLKAKGYLVGPGSVVDGKTYTVTDDRDPEPAPAGLLQLATARATGELIVSSTHLRNENDTIDLAGGVPNGQHNDFLFKLGSWLRGRWGISEDRYLATLPGLIPLLDDVDASHPFTEADFKRLAHSTASYPATRIAEDGWTPSSTAEIIKRGVPPLRWTIEELLPDGDVAIVFGKPASGKSWLALHAVHCATSGMPFLGRYRVTKHPYAIYVNLDAGARAFHRRVVRIGISDPDVLIVSPTSYNGDRLRGLLNAYPGAFVVIDSLSDAYKTARGDEQGESMRHFLRPLRAMFEEHGCSGLILDHPRRTKPGEAEPDYYGSSQKEATARVMWQINELSNSARTMKRVKVSCRKMSEGEPFEPFIAVVNLSDEQFSASYEALDASATGRSDDVTDAILSVLSEGELSRSMLVNSIGRSKAAVLAKLKGLTASGIVSRTGGGPSTRYKLCDSLDLSEN